MVKHVSAPIALSLTGWCEVSGLSQIRKYRLKRWEILRGNSKYAYPMLQKNSFNPCSYATKGVSESPHFTDEGVRLGEFK